jgi:hypothetical protein
MKHPKKIPFNPNSNVPKYVINNEIQIIITITII